ncbi:hypothetical protein EQG63_06065 [Flavobacterium amnicola]|jgi:hypothetical protein|uniref:Uncharacterized protein n=1 Tax=Flavobacterium amnicola TaxID=2506422 RepID=A0A4Q1K2Q7_9FLAO|nr:hypothetical protein [Flavobacterium amnicola]RXR19007.1 hypothetical protein EQG63_06065 [Flavobacterium amnicola]
MEQDQWIEMVLNSSNGIQKVTPDEQLFSKIMNTINEKPEVRIRTMWFAAASILLFFTLNILLINYSTSKQERQFSALTQELDKDNQLYQ